MARWHGKTTDRGLGAAHAADLRRLKAALRDGEPCWRCGQPMYSWQNLDRDHIVDRALGGADGPAVLAHANCNRSAGASMGNQLRRFTPTVAIPGRSVTCKTCGKAYHYAARTCVICGAHYHPSRGDQRTCGRVCGRVLQQRNRMAKGWVPPAQRPKPLPKPRRPGPVASGEREPKNGWPSSKLQHYTCRYCTQSFVTKATSQPREVCPAGKCQLLRLRANNWRVRYGLTQAEADAAVTCGLTTSSEPAALPRVQRPHRCPGCGKEAPRSYSWCAQCRCVSMNAKGKRCGNVAIVDGLCGYHAGEFARQSPEIAKATVASAKAHPSEPKAAIRDGRAA